MRLPGNGLTRLAMGARRRALAGSGRRLHRGAELAGTGIPDAAVQRDGAPQEHKR